MNVADVQRALIALGYDLGRWGADGIAGEATREATRAFQRKAGLLVDGIAGEKTKNALAVALAGNAAPPSPAPVPFGVIDPAWMPSVRMDRVIVHWTAGAHKASGLDRAAYHLILEGDGSLVRGSNSIGANAAPIRGAYAAHTLNCNGGSIGVSLACMAGAVERPFSAGSHPMTRTQWDRLPHVLAALCGRYGIPVTPRTVLSHAEVQGTLGIAQRGKWDIARLPFDLDVNGAEAVGNIFRARTHELLTAIS